MLMIALAGAGHSSSLPGFKLRDTKGIVWQNDKLNSGKVYLIKFWATWCVTCKKLDPMMDELVKENRNEKFQFLSVSVDQDMSKLNQYMKENPEPYPVLLDPRSTFLKALKSNAVPTILLVKNNLILGRWTGVVEKSTLNKAIQQAHRK